MIEFLLAIDQLINTLIYIQGDGWGMADESVSARAFRCHLQDLISDRAMTFIDALFFWQRAHCYNAWRAEIERSQLPNQYRGVQ